MNSKYSNRVKNDVRNRFEFDGEKMREVNENDGMREFCLSLFFAIGGVVEEFVEVKLRSEYPAKSPFFEDILVARTFPSPWRVGLEIEDT